MPLENWIPCESAQAVELIAERMRIMETAVNEPAPILLKIFPLTRDFDASIDQYQAAPALGQAKAVAAPDCKRVPTSWNMKLMAVGLRAGEPDDLDDSH